MLCGPCGSVRGLRRLEGVDLVGVRGPVSVGGQDPAPEHVGTARECPGNQPNWASVARMALHAALWWPSRGVNGNRSEIGTNPGGSPLEWGGWVSLVSGEDGMWGADFPGPAGGLGELGSVCCWVVGEFVVNSTDVVSGKGHVAGEGECDVAGVVRLIDSQCVAVALQKMPVAGTTSR